MSTIYLRKPPTDEKRPRCPQCNRMLKPSWDWMSKRIAPGGVVDYEYTKTWDGKYRGYGAFDTLRCAAEFANAAHKAGFKRRRA